ncbi:CBASS oligonucleotide cyclase [Streptomyces canus]|uniref:CBASS oligonucleotide cyclase n=1 Tax=Streptomyces canus TaxID=58343 RepID=UPI0032454838|nr:CBASS oligonucleotide cyclase [Streptomyces canus]
MGGSGGSWASNYDINRARDQAEEATERERRLSEINDFLAEQLMAFNDRDSATVRSRLDEISEILRDLTDGGIDRLLFGGSVAKHTYVDGLSDIDALVVLRNGKTDTAEQLVKNFSRHLNQRLPANLVSEVTPGRLAVTVKYTDGLEVQLLPAVERSGMVSIASEDGSSWRTINPRKFAEKLTQVNQENANGVVPAIKLAKGVFEKKLPESQRLGGYHLEAIAVDAFKNYHGSKSREAMLTHLVDHAAKAVMRPTGDITGQSVHVDNHLGATGSPERRRISAALKRIHMTLSSADLAEYKDIFRD